MARNFAQIVFLLYGLLLFSVSRQVIKKLLLKKISKVQLQKHRRGAVNTACYLTLKNRLDPFIFRLNFAAVALFSVCAVLQLLLGWFSFMALAMKIINSLTVLLVAAETCYLSLADNMLRFGKLFVLYRPTPESNRVFSSTVVDAILYLALPILVVLCNFLAL